MTNLNYITRVLIAWHLNIQHISLKYYILLKNKITMYLILTSTNFCTFCIQSNRINKKRRYNTCASDVLDFNKRQSCFSKCR